jgi:hypothetical protein
MASVWLSRLVKVRRLARPRACVPERHKGNDDQEQ